MIRRIFLFFLLVLTMALVIGCAREYFSKESYFNSAVIIEYKQTTARGQNDYLTFRFYEKGIYEISFSITPGKRDSPKHLPKGFTKVIEAVPREFVIKQYILPDFLRVTIARNGKSESHDFS